MAEDIRNKFVSWTMNVVKEIKEIPGKNNNIYGVGVNLSLARPQKKESSSTPAATSYNRVGVDSVEPHGPAAKGGLQAGDVIVEVDDKKFDDGKAYLPDDVAAAIRGPEGSQVGVVVERDGKKIKFVLTREPIGISPPPSPAMKQTQQSQSQSSRADKEAAQCKKSGGETNQQKKKNSGGQMKSEKKADTTDTSGVPDESLQSLTLAEDEGKDGNDLACSTESSDQFATSACCNLLGSVTPIVNRSVSIDEISEAEEKTSVHDHNEEISSIINSVGGENEWEMISERSGSAIVISFSGSISGASFRSASPSVLKNKFVLTESTGEPYMEHVVLPTDTLQGLCLAYKISATRLRMENNFSGNSLQMAPKKLKIPTNAKSSGMMIRTQDKTSQEFKLYAFVAEIPTMELVEAKAYLDLSNWDLDEGLRSAREDDGWNLNSDVSSQCNNFESSSPLMLAVAKPKALTAEDIYAAPPAFEGNGFELKDITQK